MTKEEILHLGMLSRLALKDEEVESLKTEIDDILAYVSTVTSIAGDSPGKAVGARYNVLRDDVVTNDPNAYTEALLQAAPQRKGNFIAVKKILEQGE